MTHAHFFSSNLHEPYSNIWRFRGCFNNNEQYYCRCRSCCFDGCLLFCPERKWKVDGQQLLSCLHFSCSLLLLLLYTRRTPQNWNPSSLSALDPSCCCLKAYATIFCFRTVYCGVRPTVATGCSCSLYSKPGSRKPWSTVLYSMWRFDDLSKDLTS